MYVKYKLHMLSINYIVLHYNIFFTLQAQHLLFVQILSSALFSNTFNLHHSLTHLGFILITFIPSMPSQTKQSFLLGFPTQNNIYCTNKPFSIVVNSPNLNMLHGKTNVCNFVLIYEQGSCLYIIYT